MSSRQVAVIDYGIGNLLSVGRAIEKCGYEPVIVAAPSDLLRSERAILPGVGAFAAGMRELDARGMGAAVREFAGSGKSLLGICLGMQLLFTESDEFGRHAGLGLIPGRVRVIPSIDAGGMPQKVPHVGWNALSLPVGMASWRGTILSSTQERSFVYYVHSFSAHPEDESHRLADSEYGGRLVCGAVHSGNVWGLQFHPEKSGPVGLEILRCFLEG